MDDDLNTKTKPENTNAAQPAGVSLDGVLVVEEKTPTLVLPNATPTDATPSDAAPSEKPLGLGEGFLDEEEPAASATRTPEPAQSVALTNNTYALAQQDHFGRRYANAPNGDAVQLVTYTGDVAWMQDLYPHPSLPALLDSKTEADQVVVAHPKLEGQNLEEALQQKDLPTVVEALVELARLNRYFTVRGYAMVGLTPREVLLGPLRLARVPLLRRIGETPAAEVPLYGTPERAAGLAVRGDEGVFVLGALLYHATTGQAPHDGEVPTVYPNVPGVPQILSNALVPSENRASPGELLEMLTNFSAQVTPRFGWQVGVCSSVGLNPERLVNEDAAAWAHTGTVGQDGRESLLAAVADGMGGMAAGEVASQRAVAAFVQHGLPLIHDGTATLLELVNKANAAAVEGLAGRGGGCTFTGVLVEGERAWLAHVGDTRAYQVAAGAVTQITQDHSFVAMLVKMGVIQPGEAHGHPDANKVTRALGSNRVIAADYVDTYEIGFAVGASLVLLTDGVWGALEPEALQKALAQSLPAQALAEHLVQKALQAGSSDNLTALVIQAQMRAAP